MATYIKTLKEDNGDITYPQTKAGAVLLTNGSDLETEMAKYVTAEDIASTSALTPPVQTNMIADYAVTTAKVADEAITDKKIDWTSFGSTDWPVVNADAYNNNINSNQWYSQYEYSVTAAGVYLVIFSQRMTNGANNNDLALRITLNNVDVSGTMYTGGSTWVNWIPGVAFVVIGAAVGDIIRCQSIGGGTGVYTTQNGRVTIARIR